MIKSFVESWDKNENKLEEYIKTHRQEEYDSYKKLVKLLFDIVINPEFNTYSESIFNTDKIDALDHGSYQGTEIFILHRDTYMPDIEDYVYTYVFYGSCSVCDTLRAIHCYDEGLPSERQVKDYMQLCLHLLQRCTYMEEEV